MLALFLVPRLCLGTDTAAEPRRHCHWSQLKGQYPFWVRSWVPSPLAGNGIKLRNGCHCEERQRRSNLL
jgi:hypothetical protein